MSKLQILPMQSMASISQAINKNLDSAPSTHRRSESTQAERQSSKADETENLEPIERCLRPDGSPFQVVGPATEKERLCIVAEPANGTSKSPWTEDHSVRWPAEKERAAKLAQIYRKAPSLISTATTRTRSCMRCVVGMEASATPCVHTGKCDRTNLCCHQMPSQSMGIFFLDLGIF